MRPARDNTFIGNLCAEIALPETMKDHGFGASKYMDQGEGGVEHVSLAAFRRIGRNLKAGVAELVKEI